MPKQKQSRARQNSVKTWKIKNEVFCYDLFVRMGGTVEEADRWAAKVLGYDYQPRCDEHLIEGSTYAAHDCSDHAIWFCGKPGAGVISHEALHSVQHVFEHIGMEPMCEENEEAYAYLLTWTVQQIGRRIWS